MIYQLSNYGRAITFQTWKSIGGNGLPNHTNAYKKLGPLAKWDKSKITLGDIEDACPATGRGLARFAAENLLIPAIAKQYEGL
ncbi:hypothetical protein [uncultured Methylophaga sp.]|uniref:hypothetical protein n=1 Tax=uncultured Methylophaga sp. TaxID=285271 RepID=UPI0030F63BE4